MSARCTWSPVGKIKIFIFTTSLCACLTQNGPLNPYLWKLGNPYFYIIPFRQAIIGQCPIGLNVGPGLPGVGTGVVVTLLTCQIECAGLGIVGFGLGCLPPDVCNVIADPSNGIGYSIDCVTPLPTQVNDRLLLEHIYSGYLVTPQNSSTIFDGPNVSGNSWAASPFSNKCELVQKLCNKEKLLHHFFCFELQSKQTIESLDFNQVWICSEDEAIKPMYVLHHFFNTYLHHGLYIGWSLPALYC